MKRKWMIGVILVTYIMAISLPYLYQPGMSKDPKPHKHSATVVGQSSRDQAVIIEDNEAALEERIRMIHGAQERIILSTFHFKSDQSGKQMLAALYDAAERGVQIQILVDGAFSLLSMTGNPYFQLLAAHQNVTLKQYNPIHLLTPWKWMSRMHDKYIIADRDVYLLGGRNTYDCFLSNIEGKRNYDRDVLVVNTGSEGSSLYALESYFMSIWEQKECKVWHGRTSSKTEKARETLTQLYQTMQQEHPQWFEPTDYIERTYPVDGITLLSNPTRTGSKEPELFSALVACMKQAQKQVIIHTPYIICNGDMYDAFREISAGGTSVTLMTNAAATGANPFGTTDYVRNKEKILDTGLQVLEYAGDRSYHAKSILIDDDISIIGSFNMDMKSVYQDTELMLVIQSEDINRQLASIMASYQEDASAAVLSEHPIEELMAGQTPMEKLAKIFLWLVTPLVRFLL